MSNFSRTECDDEYVRYEGGSLLDEYHGGGDGHGHGDEKKTEDGHGHGEKKKDDGHGHSHGGGRGPSEKDIQLYNASMFKLKLVSFVSTFFIIA